MSEKVKEGLLWAAAAVLVGICCLLAAIGAPDLHSAGKPAVSVETVPTASLTTAASDATTVVTQPTAGSATVSHETTVPDRGPVKIDLNTADRETLMTLPGIGPVLADRIIAYREDYGGFKLIDELKLVKGIGDKIYEAIASFVCTE